MIAAQLLVKAVRKCFHKLLEDIHSEDHAPMLFAELALSQDEFQQINAAIGDTKNVILRIVFAIYNGGNNLWFLTWLLVQ